MWRGWGLCLPSEKKEIKPQEWRQASPFGSLRTSKAPFSRRHNKTGLKVWPDIIIWWTGPIYSARHWRGACAMAGLDRAALLLGQDGHRKKC